MCDVRELERRSSAVTLSDMEVFIFPELIYSLVLANLMSPRIWAWREDPWFDGIARMNPYRRISRLKQYVMDHYMFNLDLDTWGLTTKQRELARFAPFIDETTLARSNALFGYEGDKYYFDIDIRTHFGLDRYTADTIPYWKTETVEAMDAFRYKANYETGAGECVSLATLYAAALFIVARIPLSDIFLMATPLHSQNFVDVGDGILTNNRRLVTKAMWFNGTALSDQARRALENERVTIVAHETGVVHTLYREMSLDAGAYARFRDRLRAYLSQPLDDEMLGNFLRHSRDMQCCFQMRHTLRGRDAYIPMNRVYAYEHGSPYRVTDATRVKLLADIETEEFVPAPLPNRIILNDLEAFVREHRIDIFNADDGIRLKRQFATDCLNAADALERLLRFCRVEPRLPDAAAKTAAPPARPLGIDPDMSRDEIEARLADIRGDNLMADMAFHAWRDLSQADAAPFLKAAMERNPVIVEALRDQAPAAVAERLRALPSVSIYDGPARLAQPDEVWNFGRGDGLEKAVALAAVRRALRPDDALAVVYEPGRAVVRAAAEDIVFESEKRLGEGEWRLN